jgi:hypothetical protein
MNLEKYTTEELHEELKRRENLVKDDSQKLYIGLIDSHGVESIILADTKDLFSKAMSTLELRSRFNTQRSPEIYSVRMPVDLFSILNDKLKNGYDGDFIEVANVLKGLSTYRKIG